MTDSTPLRRLLAVLALTLPIAMPASATARAQADAARTHAGTFSATPDLESGKPLAPGAPRDAALASAQRVLDILRADGALANPVGFSVVVRRLASARLPADAPGMPYHSAVVGSLDYFMVGKDGRIVPDGGRVAFHVAINTVGSEVEIESTDGEADGGPRVMLDVRKTGEFRGRPVYNGSCTYVARRSASPLIPVTQERYLTLELLKARAEAARHEGQRQASTSSPTNDAFRQFLRDKPQRDAQNKKTLDALREAGADASTIRQASDAFREAEQKQEAALRDAAAGGADQNYQDVLKRAREGEGEGIAQLQAKLDALSPAERKGPAYLLDHGRGEYTLGTSGDPDAILAMQPNPAFYDQTIAPTQPQVLWICLPGLQGVVDSSAYDRFAGDEREQEKRTAEQRTADALRIRDKLDWPALEALVKP